MIKEFKNLPDISMPPAYFDAKHSHSWYAFIFQYNQKQLGDLSIEKFFEALQAEGLN